MRTWWSLTCQLTQRSPLTWSQSEKITCLTLCSILLIRNPSSKTSTRRKHLSSRTNQKEDLTRLWRTRCLVWICRKCLRIPRRSRCIFGCLRKAWRVKTLSIALAPTMWVRLSLPSRKTRQVFTSAHRLNSETLFARLFRTKWDMTLPVTSLVTRRAASFRQEILKAKSRRLSHIRAITQTSIWISRKTSPFSWKEPKSGVLGFSQACKHLLLASLLTTRKWLLIWKPKLRSFSTTTVLTF